MYVLVYKDRVLVGPRDWSKPMFDGALEKLKIEAIIPRKEPDVFPWVLNEDAYITEASVVIPPHNEKIETYHGPYWDFSNMQLAVGTYGIKEKQIGSIKELLINQAAEERYRKEIAGTKMTVQNLEVTLDTSRDGRNIFVQKYSLMTDSDLVNWKFPEGWLTLTKAELGSIVLQGAAHIQGSFDWEKAKVDEINAAETAAELDQIVIFKQETPIEQFM